jgi:hypothetical protein
MYLREVADTAQWFGTPDGDLNERTHGPAVTRRVLRRKKTTTAGLFGGKSEEIRVTGEVEAYVCADCGYLEEYLRDPRAIDWNKIVGAYPYAKPQPGGPFR